jgi:hypothetical protein
MAQPPAAGHAAGGHTALGYRSVGLLANRTNLSGRPGRIAAKLNRHPKQ